MSFLFVCILIVSIWASSKYFGRIINAVTIFVVPNCVSLLLLFGCDWVRHDLSITTYIILLLSIVMYILGVAFSSYISIGGLGGNASASIDGKKINTCSIFCSIVFDIAAFLYLAEIADIYGLSGMFGQLSEVNIAQQSGNLNGIYNYIFPLSAPLAFLLIFSFRNEKDSKKKAVIALQLAVCFLPFVFSARRSQLFSLLVSVLLYAVLSSGKSSVFNFRSFKKAIGLFGLIILASLFMSITQQLMNKSLDSENMTFLGFEIPFMLVDPLNYIVGNYAYFDHNSFNEMFEKVPVLFLSTLRLFYLYFAPLFGIQVDANGPFELPFIDISNGLTPVLFNTEPMLYYVIVDVGIFFPFLLFVWGFIAQKAYKSITSSRGIYSAGLSVTCFSILFWSFRSYDLIFLSTGLTLVYSLLMYIYFINDSKGNDGHQDR